MSRLDRAQDWAGCGIALMLGACAQRPVGIAPDPAASVTSRAAGSFVLRDGGPSWPVATIAAEGTSTCPAYPELAPGRYAFRSDGLWYWINIPEPK